MSFTQREARRIVRQAVGRVPQGEDIRHLNIMPMMDMMTILLVTFIFQMASSSNDLEANKVVLPHTPTDELLPDRAATLIITKNGITVEGKPIVSISNGQVEPTKKEGGMTGIKIIPLTAFLTNYRAAEIANLKASGKYAPNNPPPAELMIIADRTTPYRVLVEVMFSAKQKEAGYKRFRLIVQKAFPVGSGG